MAEEMDKELKALKADFAKLNAAVSDLADDVRALLAATLDEGEEKARTRAKEKLDDVKKRFEEVRGRSHEYAESTEARIVEHPFASLVTAFGIGFLLAKIMDIGQSR
ncbi:MAG: DUF883 family protein [Gammaproteobacteria bacterium]